MVSKEETTYKGSEKWDFCAINTASHPKGLAGHPWGPHLLAAAYRSSAMASMTLFCFLELSILPV